MYITALNSDNLPDINTSWKIVIDSQLKSAYDTGLDYYTNHRQEAYTAYLQKEKTKYAWSNMTRAFLKVKGEK